MTTTDHVGVLVRIAWYCSLIATSTQELCTEQCDAANAAMETYATIITDMSHDHNVLSDKIIKVSTDLRQHRKQFKDNCERFKGDNSESTHILNVRHYHVKQMDDRQSFGAVQTVRYNKVRHDTAIRVTWISTTNTIDILRSQSRSCGQYSVTFNGRQCKNPGNIDFTSTGMNCDHHESSELDGICYDQPAGSLNVSIVAGACPNRSNSAFFTGWKTSRNMWVYEIAPAEIQDSPQTAAVPLMNTKYYASKSMQTNTGLNISLMTMTYNKLSNYTMLRIKWTGTVRVAGYSVSLNQSQRRCARWQAPISKNWFTYQRYITVDGTECSPKVHFIIGMFEHSRIHAADSHKTVTLEGFCPRIASGMHNITLRIGTCEYYSHLPQAETVTGCCNSSSRIIVSEVRTANTQLDVATISDAKNQQFPFFNLKQWTWEMIEREENNNTIKSVTYIKLSGASGLHVRAVGDARVFGDRSCCRWYFVINGNECSDPGTIEGVLFLQYYLTYHSPLVVDGVCYGVRSGNVDIAYNVSPCQGVATGDCWTGHASALHLIVEETQPGQRVSCPSALDC